MLGTCRVGCYYLVRIVIAVYLAGTREQRIGANLPAFAHLSAAGKTVYHHGGITLFAACQFRDPTLFDYTARALAKIRSKVAISGVQQADENDAGDADEEQAPYQKKNPSAERRLWMFCAGAHLKVHRSWNGLPLKIPLP